MRKLTTTRGFLMSILNKVKEVGYGSLLDYEKEVIDAYDHNMLNIIEQEK